MNRVFDKDSTIGELKKFLPPLVPLKDFIFYNNLEGFKKSEFKKALKTAHEIFGYKVSLSLNEYRELYATNRIRNSIVEKVIAEREGKEAVEYWKEKMLSEKFINTTSQRIGMVRSHWKKDYHIDMSSMIHPLLFRIVCSYLDQGISIWNFPLWEQGFLHSLRELEEHSYSSFFKTKKAKQRLLKDNLTVKGLLDELVGEETFYEHYLFDLQFAHPGWSGLVAAVETQPQVLLDPKRITLEEFIIVELLLEIDYLDAHFGEGKWLPLCKKARITAPSLFSEVKETELDNVLWLWQESYEWDYYDQVLAGLQTLERSPIVQEKKPSFQAFFCIDDRECSIRRHIEKLDPNCTTYGTPGFFNVEFYFQPANTKFYTKLCPAPVTPRYLIKEIASGEKREKEVHFTKFTHSLAGGLLASTTLGFIAGFKLMRNIFKPAMSPSVASSFNHMNKASELTIENKNPQDRENNLQIGFTIEEMAKRVEELLKSIGLIRDFAPLIYVIGHGASSVNNPFYATMDCGACSCRPGSVNARVFSIMANKPEVRQLLAERGMEIPETTRFVGGLHDTTRDEIQFFDEESLSEALSQLHNDNLKIIEVALDNNAKERSRRFASVDSKLNPAVIHEKIRERSVALFETRPELDHATNALCVVGRRKLTEKLFLDRRAFMNSYDYKIDPDGNYLHRILRAATPVCGDINLGFYFSKVDNQKLGAGTKLPHNVMGLLAVANGAEGDLRPGLPKQMIESHVPLRLLMIVEAPPERVLNVIRREQSMYDYYINNWCHLAVINPEDGEVYLFKEGEFVPYRILETRLETLPNITALIETTGSFDNIPVYLLK